MFTFNSYSLPLPFSPRQATPEEMQELLNFNLYVPGRTETCFSKEALLYRAWWVYFSKDEIDTELGLDSDDINEYWILWSENKLGLSFEQAEAIDIELMCC